MLLALFLPLSLKTMKKSPLVRVKKTVTGCFKWLT